MYFTTTCCLWVCVKKVTRPVGQTITSETRSLRPNRPFGVSLPPLCSACTGTPSPSTLRGRRTARNIYKTNTQNKVMMRKSGLQTPAGDDEERGRRGPGLHSFTRSPARCPTEHRLDPSARGSTPTPASVPGRRGYPLLFSIGMSYGLCCLYIYLYIFGLCIGVP